MRFEKGIILFRTDSATSLSTSLFFLFPVNRLAVPVVRGKTEQDFYNVHISQTFLYGEIKSPYGRSV